MSDEPQNDLMKEIDAIVQNSGKKKMAFEVSRHVEIVVDKEKSSEKVICGSFAIVTEKRFLDGSKKAEDYARYEFMVDNKKDLTIEGYNTLRPIRKSTFKVIHDMIMAVVDVAGVGVTRYPIADKNVYSVDDSIKKNMLVICESGKNKAVKDRVEEILFTGQAHHHIDLGSFRNVIDCDEKERRWGFLEMERLLAIGETVVVTGTFNHWYEFMPLAVISRMYNISLVIGRSPGQKIAVGDVLDLDIVLEHFLSKEHTLEQFYSDPYSAIEHFKQIDGVIGSLVVFPSVLHKFLSR